MFFKEAYSHFGRQNTKKKHPINLTLNFAFDKLFDRYIKKFLAITIDFTNHYISRD